VRDFELPAQDERPVRLARELTGGAVVLVFYRGDW
jgi:peroxiredoxin